MDYSNNNSGLNNENTFAGNTMGNHLEGVMCNVENCVYNTSHACTAKHIKVKSTNAIIGEETMCGTFEERM